MKSKFLLLLTTAMFFIGCVGEEIPINPKEPEVPIPNHGNPMNVPEDEIHWLRPSRTSELRQDLITAYNDYKSRFLRGPFNGNYYVSAGGTFGEGTTFVTQSEAHGYGMMIFALATWDKDAKTIFDGMNQIRKANPSTGNPALMSWVICKSSESLTSGVPASARGSSATDGDLDMAYALLLAHKRWEDQSYLSEARTIINALKASCVAPQTLRTRLGDWGHWGDPQGLNTRSSDWMPGHFRAFHRATNDDFWLRAADTVYSLLSQISNPQTGLMPCFLTGIGTDISPDPNCGFAFGEPDGCVNYSANACRVPWRLATDYIHHEDADAKRQINRISSWLRNATSGIPRSIGGGYTLNGTALRSNGGLHFTAPFAAGMVADETNQQFLNLTWNHIITQRAANSYGAAIRLLCMLLISGNWAAP